MAKEITCIIVDDEKIAREVLETHLSKIGHIQLVASCKNALEAYRVISEQHIDLAFLDINMPEIDGLAFARTAGKGLKIIFTTAYRDYAVEGFDLQALDYLLKPISLERLMQAITKYRETNVNLSYGASSSSPEKNSDYFFIRSERKMARINYDEILFVESLSDYTKFHLINRSVITRESLGIIESQLPKDKFLRIHRSYIVAISKIHSYTNEDVEVNGIEVPISRSHKPIVIKRLQKGSGPQTSE